MNEKNCVICESKMNHKLDMIGGICLNCANTNVGFSEENLPFNDFSETKEFKVSTY